MKPKSRSLQTLSRWDNSFSTLADPRELTVGVGGQYPTIARALAAASSGQRVGILPGSYAEGNLQVPVGVGVRATPDTVTVTHGGVGEPVFNCLGGNKLYGMSIRHTDTSSRGDNCVRVSGINTELRQLRMFGGREHVRIACAADGYVVVKSCYSADVYGVVVKVRVQNVPLTMNIYVTGHVVRSDVATTGGVVDGNFFDLQEDQCMNFRGRVYLLDNDINWAATNASLKYVYEGGQAFSRTSGQYGLITSENNRIVLDGGAGDAYYLKINAQQQNIGVGKFNLVNWFTSSGDTFLPTAATNKVVLFITPASNFTTYGTFDISDFTTDDQYTINLGAGTDNTFSPPFGWGSLTATGTTIADAEPLIYEENTVTGAANAGLLLAASANNPIEVINDGSNTLLVYPNSASVQIDALGVGNPYSVAAGVTRTFTFVAPTQWYSS